MKPLLYIWLIALFILHFDFWFADSTVLVFGFIPGGLFYQMAFTMVAALTWFLICKYCWPDDLEEDETEGDNE